VRRGGWRVACGYVCGERVIGRKARARWYIHTHARMHAHARRHARMHTLSLSLSLSLTHTHTHTLSLTLSLTGAKWIYAGVDDDAGWHKFYGQMITVA
jgi:hypothetical protein